MTAHIRIGALLLGLALPPCVGLAQTSERFGPYELHYSVVNTTFLDPKVAEIYGITRSQKRAIVNLSVQEHQEGGGSAARHMTLEGHVRDLIQSRQKLEFREIREGDAIYYIAEFPFINEEWRFFEIVFQPEGGSQSYTFSFKRQLYRD